MPAIRPTVYAVLVTSVGFLCLVISATAVGVPQWAYYERRGTEDRGYFGPWQKCQQLNYRERCGEGVGRFQPSAVVFVSGLLAVGGCVLFGIFCILSIVQIAMIASRDRVCMSYKALVLSKLVATVVAAGLSLAAAILFSLQTDDTSRGYEITRGISFYLQLLVTGLSLALLALASYDRILTKRPDGDPTMLSNATTNGRRGRPAGTYNNPGFRETTSNNPNGIAVTDSSGRPYSSGMNGSMQSVNTTVTTVSNGSTVGSGSVTRTPLRSSLKKPRPPGSNTTTDGLGIRNPGYSGGNQSPRMQRNGSVKKVRIQTHSTDV
ncbi:AGAP005433-PA-like protein [Anopheles sinensis]|uniref:AGAP005433-PA-like protein n=1 Tax=Anopheles sinensis TaxID=74873 RepID=A0A084VD88_ANOSI|nr:AGAP005433-PA-like protein [Anopheles sinensis]